MTLITVQDFTDADQRLHADALLYYIGIPADSRAFPATIASSVRMVFLLSFLEFS